MYTPSRHQGAPVTDTRQEAGAHPTSTSPTRGRPVRGYGFVCLCLAAVAFVTAPFLILIPVSGFIPAVLAAAGVMFTWIGLRRSGRRPGLAVAGFIISVVLLGLTLSIAVPWIRLVVVPAVSAHPEVQEVIGHIRLVPHDTGGQELFGLLAGVLLVAGGLLLRRRHS